MASDGRGKAPFQTVWGVDFNGQTVTSHFLPLISSHDVDNNNAGPKPLKQFFFTPAPASGNPPRALHQYRQRRV